MRFPLFPCLVAVVALSSVASGQQQSAAAMAALRPSTTLTSGDATLPQRESELLTPSKLAVPGREKDPMTAAVLSALVPGLGSFYAGDSGHGMVHLGIDLGAYILMLGSATNGSAGGTEVGFLAYLGNGIWSIFTAVHDTDAYNLANGKATQKGRIIGDLFIDPAIVHLRAEHTPRGTTDHAGMQFVRLTF